MNWTGEYTLAEFFRMTYENGHYPPVENLIHGQIQINQYIANEAIRKKLIVRAYKDFTRARIYQIQDEVFATSDNEACVSFYQFVRNNLAFDLGEDIFQFYARNKLSISFAHDEGYEKVFFVGMAKDLGISVGGVRDVFRSQYNLKLSHHVDAADGLIGNENLKKRFAIFLSPFNIVLTPKTFRQEKNTVSGFKHRAFRNGVEFSISRNDIGEHKEIKELLHLLLLSKILECDKGKEAYEMYCKICGLSFTDQLERLNNLNNDINEYKISFSGTVVRPLQETETPVVPNIGVPKELSPKKRLIFRKEEIGTLDDEQIITFKIQAEENEYSADPRKIDGQFTCKIKDVKTFFKWETDVDWSKGQNSKSKFPKSAEKYFSGTLGNRVIRNGR